MKVMKAGIQLYSVRGALEQDFKGTCRRLADMGYQGFEFAWNYGGMNPAELAAFLADIGVAACGLHTGTDELIDPASPVYEYAAALKLPCVTCSSSGDFKHEWPAMAEKFDIAGRTAAAHGIQFTYHNHHQEFVRSGGECVLDLIYENTNPEFVQAELDVCWIHYAGENPAEYIRRYRDRVPQIHMKDLTADQKITELGAGTVDLAECAAAARNSICEWMIYEQDSSEKSPLVSAEESIGVLRRLIAE